MQLQPKQNQHKFHTNRYRKAKRKANLRHKPTITNVCFRHLRREKTHFAPLVLAKIAKQNVNLQSQDARLFFSPKQLLKFTRNKHNSCFCQTELKIFSKQRLGSCLRKTDFKISQPFKTSRS